MHSPKFIDLFSGAGLFSQGFIEVGFQPVAAFDVDEYAIASYNRNISEVAECASVLNVRKNIKCDVLIAGPPCQGFSTLGRRDPADSRNSYCLAIPAWAKTTKAKIVVVENVPQFLGSSQFKELSAELENDGFSITTSVLNSENFGSPQRRRRAFTIASLMGPIQGPTNPTTVDLVPASSVFGKIRRNDPMHVWPEPTPLALERMKKIGPCGDKRDLFPFPHLCPPSWKKMGAAAVDVWGRINMDQPSNTIRCRFQNPSTGRYTHPTENRVLSLREGARLQGVPDDWIFEGHMSSQARQIGNGVPVLLAKAVAAKILSGLAEEQVSAFAA